MSSRLTAFIVAQGIVSVIAASLDHSGTQLFGYVFFGVTSAQFALLGIWFAIGNPRNRQRYAIAAVGAVGLCVITVLRTPFNGWELLLAMVRAPVLGIVFSSLRRKRNLILRRTGACADVRLIRLTLTQLFVLTLVIAVFLAMLRALDIYGGPVYEIFFLIWVILIGVGGALASVIAAALTLSRLDFTSAIVSAIAIVVLAAAMAWFGFSQTDSRETTLQCFTFPVLEAVVAGASIAALRMFGYCLSDA